jgi:hypothetical protein
MTVSRGDEQFIAEIGSEFVVPAGVPHQMAPASEEGAVMRWRTTPALRTDEMFCALWEAARDAEWEPDLAALFGVIRSFPDEFCLC